MVYKYPVLQSLRLDRQFIQCVKNTVHYSPKYSKQMTNGFVLSDFAKNFNLDLIFELADIRSKSVKY